MSESTLTSRPGAVGLLLPGMTLNATIFPDLPVSTLAADFNQLGVGPDGSAGSTSAQQLGLYVRLLDDLLEESPAWQRDRRLIIAHSFGGMLALSWLLHHQGTGLGRVEGLVLIATTAGPMYEAARIRIAKLGRRELRIGSKYIMPLWNREAVTKTVKRLLTHGSLQTQQVDFQQLGRKSDLAVGLAGWRNCGWRARMSFRVAMEGFDARARLPEIEVQTIILHGSDDTFFPIEAAAELARTLPRSELRLIEGAAHCLPLTHGDAVVQAVEDLL